MEPPDFRTVDSTDPFGAALERARIALAKGEHGTTLQELDLARASAPRDDQASLSRVTELATKLAAESTGFVRAGAEELANATSVGSTAAPTETAVAAASSQSEPDLIAEVSALRQSNEQRDLRAAKTRKVLLASGLIGFLLLLGLWETGRMDPFLSQFGLNKNTCIKNGFGATFCGGDATRYQQGIQSIVGGNTSDQSGLESDVRSAIPSAEAYYSDQGTYTGLTAAKMREYDPGLPPDISVKVAAGNRYCIEANSGTGAVASFTRPGQTVTAGPC